MTSIRVAVFGLFAVAVSCLFLHAQQTSPSSVLSAVVPRLDNADFRLTSFDRRLQISDSRLTIVSNQQRVSLRSAMLVQRGVSSVGNVRRRAQSVLRCYYPCNDIWEGFRSQTEVSGAQHIKVRRSRRKAPSRTGHHYRHERFGESVRTEGLRGSGLLLRGQPAGRTDP